MARRRITLDRDPGLLARMTGTVFLLGLVYVIFFVVLLQAVGLALPVVIVLAGGLLVVQYWTSDKIALASARARIVDESQAPELHAIIQRLCLTAGLPMPRVAIVPTDMPNAFATGRSPKHAAVAVTQGLLDRLEPHELEGVLAHELSHVAHRDVAVMTLASFFAMVAGFITRMGFYFGMFGGFGGGFGGGRDDRNNSGASFMVILLVSMVVYAISFVLIRTLSRYREFAADRGAAVLTKSPSSLASALVKISGAMGRIPQRDMRMAEGLNQFFIIPANLKSGLSTLVSDHPPLEARLEQLRRLERQLETL
jgi:heat shock protein HtpX